MSSNSSPYKKGPWQKKDAKPAYQSQRGKLTPLMTEEQKRKDRSREEIIVHHESRIPHHDSIIRFPDYPIIRLSSIVHR